MNWIPAFAGMTDEEKINRGFRVTILPWQEIFDLI
jgi:hypothetical protein